MKTKFLIKKTIAVLMAIALIFSAVSASLSVLAADTSLEDIYVVNEGRFIDAVSAVNAKVDFSVIKDVSPDGEAYGLTSTASSGADLVNFKFYGIDAETAKAMDAFSLWIKVPYNKSYDLRPNFNEEKWRFNGTITAYDTFKHTTTTVTGPDGIILPAGFEGYVVFDLKNGAVKNAWGDTPTYTWSEFVTEYGIKSFSPYTYCSYLNGRTVVFDSFAFVSENYVNNIASTYSAASKFVIKDGTSSTTNVTSTNFNLTYNIENILKNKYVCKVDVTATTTGWKNLNIAADFTTAGFTAADTKTLSYFIKVPDDISDFKLRVFEYRDSPWHEVKLTKVYCYLVDTKKETISRVQADSNARVTFPAGFEGYVIQDISTSTDLSTFLSYNLAGLYFSSFYSETQLGMSWYYGDVALWSESAEAVLDRYHDYKLVDDGTSETSLKGWFTNAPDYTAQIVTDVSPDKSCISYTIAETTGVIKMHFPAFATIEPELIKTQKAAVMWVDFEGAKDFYALLRYNNSDEMRITTNITTVNTNTGEIITTPNTARLDLANNFRGYVILDLENAMVDSGWDDDKEDADTPKNFDEYMGEVAFTQISLYMNPQAMDNSTICFDSLAYTTNTDEFISQVTSALPLGDANEDGSTDVLDLVRMKKYMANLTPDINYFRANVSNGAALDSLDVSALRKVLLSLEDTIVSETNNQVGMAMYHSAIGDWDASYSTTYGAEADFVNYYRVTSMSEAAAVKEANGMCWLYVHDPFADRTATEFDEGFEESFKQKVQNYKDAGLWDVIAGFETEEATTRLTQEQFIKMTKFIKEVCPEKRILACTSPYEINGKTLNGGTEDEIVIEPLTAEALAYVTDIGYDEYPSNDENYHRELLAKMKAVAPSDARIWFFPCTYNYYGAKTEEDMLASLNLTYKLLCEQENPGGLYLYTWETFSEGSEALDVLLDPNGDYNYSTLANRIVEIGKDILAK